MITPAIKDKVLNAILAEDELMIVLSYDDVFPNKEIPYWEFKLVLRSFVSYGLLHKLGCHHETMNTMTKDAGLYDLHQHGGFVGREEILKANLEKLNRELLVLADKLEPSELDRLKNISDIAGSIITFLGLIKS